MLSVQKLAEYLEPIIAACPLWYNETLEVTIIANPTAGGFTQKKRAKEHEQILIKEKESAETKPKQCTALYTTVYSTQYENHAVELSRKTAEKALTNPHIKQLIICAGGDGTYLEVLTALVKMPLYKQTLSEQITVLRLPFGTGNDGADGKNLSTTLELLTQNAQFAFQSAVRVLYANNSTEHALYAFNIASIGIDAFITHKTNHTKGFLPGDFYKLWIDLACLFYEVFFPSSKAHICAYDKNKNLTFSFDNSFLFCLFGESGFRTYGSNQKILPNEHNACIGKKMNLLTKLLQKEKFKTGAHVNSPYAVLFSAQKMIIDYDKTILLQTDGEVHLLNPHNFPLILEKTEPLIKIIKRVL